MEVGSLWPGYRDLGSPQVFFPIGSTDRWCYFLATPSGDLAILIALETMKHIPFWFLVHI